MTPILFSLAVLAADPQPPLVPHGYWVQPPNWVGFYVVYQWEPAERPSTDAMVRWLLDREPTFTVSFRLDAPMEPGDFGQIVNRFRNAHADYLRAKREWESCDINGDGQRDGDDIQPFVTVTMQQGAQP